MQTWFQLAGLALKISISLQVFAMGLAATWQQATYLFWEPRLLWNSILARNVAVPIVAVLLIKLFPFHVTVAITLGVLAVTPVPPLLAKSQLKSGARSEYVLGLLVSQSVLAIVLVPITIRFMDWALGARAHFSAGQVWVLILKSVLAPLTAGMVVSVVLPKLRRVAPILMTIGTVMLITGAVPMLLLAWNAYGTLSRNGAMLAMILFVIAGIAAGHFLGGPAREDRTTLAIASPSRHPAIALAVATTNFPDQSNLVTGAVIIYLIIRLIFSMPYVRWRHQPELGLVSPNI